MTHPARENEVASHRIRLERLIGNDASEPPVQSPSDAELVMLGGRGDAAALDALVRRHYRAAYAVAFAVTACADDAEDITHDALINALARLDQCRDPSRFGQWLAVVVRNRARNELAKPGARRASGVDPNSIAADGSTPRAMDRDELRIAIEAAMALLSEPQREVVLLHDLYDWPHDAIAERLGTSAGMSRQHLFKARRQLRETLGPELLREYFDE
jgi:RNA polymerase sigma-70 factor (ECF subfamily)